MRDGQDRVISLPLVPARVIIKRDNGGTIQSMRNSMSKIGNVLDVVIEIR